jgi:large subunit ribosomal protein L17
MLRNLAAGLFEHGQIETTLPKAKAVQPFVEKIITIAKRGGYNSRKRIEQLINDRKIHSWVADPNVPDSAKHNDHFDLPSESDIEFNRYGEVRKAPRLVQHIMSVVGPKFADRDGGYTRIVKIGKRRLGDGTDLCVLQLVGEEEGPQLGGGDSRRRTQKQRRRDFAAKVLVATAVTDEPAEQIIDETLAQEASEEVTEVIEVTEAPETEEPAAEEETTEAEVTPEIEETPEAEVTPEAEETPEGDETPEVEKE